VAAAKVNTFKDEQVPSNNIYPPSGLWEYTCTVSLHLPWLSCAYFGTVVHSNYCCLEMLFFTQQISTKDSHTVHPVSSEVYTHYFWALYTCVSIYFFKDWYIMHNIQCHHRLILHSTGLFKHIKLIVRTVDNTFYSISNKHEESQWYYKAQALKVLYLSQTW